MLKAAIAVIAAAVLVTGCAGGNTDALQGLTTQSIGSAGQAVVVARLEAHNYNFLGQDLVAPGVVTLTPKPGSAHTEPIILWPGRSAPPPAGIITGTLPRPGQYFIGEAGGGWNKANTAVMQVAPGEYHLAVFETHNATWYGNASDALAGKGRFGTVTVKPGEVVSIGALHYYLNEKVGSTPAGHKGRFEVVADEAAARGFLAANYPALAQGMVSRPMELSVAATKAGGS